MAVNPNTPPIPEPLAEITALTAVARALKQRVEALTGQLAVLQAAVNISPGGAVASSTSYVLPVASTTQLGGVRVDGTTTTVAAGVLSAHLAGTVPLPADATPLMSGSAAIGTSLDYAREDHRHPHDTSNPEGYQTASQVALAVAGSSYILTTAKFGALNLTTLPDFNPGALNDVSDGFIMNQTGVTSVWDFHSFYAITVDVVDYITNPLNAEATDMDGRPIYFYAGDGDGTGYGGALGLYAGTGGATGGGGDVTIRSGDAGTGHGGGNITIQGASGDTAAGIITMIAGPDPTSGDYTSVILDPALQAQIYGPSVRINLGGTPSSNLFLYGVPIIDTAVADSVWWDTGVLVQTGFTLAGSVGALLAATFAATDLSGLPTANPGGGKPWLNGGVLQVGA